MPIFYCNRNYDPNLDIRDYGDLPAIAVTPPPGVMWLFLSRRRGRKTWTLKGLEHKLGKDRAGYHDLGTQVMPKARGVSGFVHLLDEPAHFLERNRIRRFLRTCRALHEGNERVLLALTPQELQQLADWDPDMRDVARYDARLRLPVFSEEEAGRQAARAPLAIDLLDELPPEWRSSPFLLELLFEVAEKEALRGTELLRASLLRCRQLRYFNVVFQGSLNEIQRGALRDLARGAAQVPDAMLEILRDAGYVSVEKDRGATVHDPFLAAHLYPLRIHHLSDMHFGSNTAPAIDAAEEGPLPDPAGRKAKLRDYYLTQVQALRSRDRAPHMIVVSGDLAEIAAEAELQEAREFLEKLRALLQPSLLLSEPRIILVGGNHDVDWGKAAEPDPQARHRGFARTFPSETYPHPRLDLSPETRPVARVALPDFGVELLLLGSSEVGGALEERTAMKRLEEDEAARTPPDAALDEEDAVQFARVDPGLVHYQDLQRARTYAWKAPVRIAVVHHPVTSTPSAEIRRYAGLLNAGAVKEVLFANQFALVLHGHLHAAFFIEERWPGRYDNWMLRVVSAASLGSSYVLEHNGYNEIEILRDIEAISEPGAEDMKETCKVLVRRFVRNSNLDWAEEDVLGPFEPGKP